MMSAAIPSHPLVSIGMPVWNGERFLGRALNALLDQTYTHFELIIRDDHSTDGSLALARDFAARDTRIRLSAGERNIGMNDNFAATLAEAKGDYFMWAAQDDWWHPTFIEKLLAALEEHHEYGVAMSYFSDNGLTKGELTGGRRFYAHSYTNKTYYEVYREVQSGLINPIFQYGLFRTPFIRALYARQMPPSREDARILMCEAALATRFYSVPEELFFKERDPRTLSERHGHDPVGQRYIETRSYQRYLWVSLWWPLTSAVIPWWRKTYVLFPMAVLLWRSRRKMLRA